MWDTLSSFSCLRLDVTDRASVASDAAFALPARGLRFATAPVDLSAFSPAVVGVVLGALFGVVAFIGIAVLVTRRGRRRAPAGQGAAFSDEVVVIPPYATLPVDPFAAGPSGSARPSRSPSFAPTSELSARALSGMGYDVDVAAPGLTPAPAQAWVSAASSSAEMLPSELLCDEDSQPQPAVASVPKAPDTAPILGSPVVMVGEPARHEPILPPPSGPRAAPHPLSILGKIPSLVAERVEPKIAGANVADLELDDNPTEIAETVFDEPPQPRRRGSRPKIRRVEPASPRLPSPRPAAGRPASAPEIARDSRPAPSHSGIVFSAEEGDPTEVFLVRKVAPRGA
jgi:hypothetical protein